MQYDSKHLLDYVLRIGLEWLMLDENRTLRNPKTQQWSSGNSYVCFVLIIDRRQLTTEGTSTVNCRRFPSSAVNYRRGISVIYMCFSLCMCVNRNFLIFYKNIDKLARWREIFNHTLLVENYSFHLNYYFWVLVCIQTTFITSNTWHKWHVIDKHNLQKQYNEFDNNTHS